MFSPEWLGQALASQANPGYSDALDQGIWYDPPFMGSSREIFNGENFQQAARTYLRHLCRLLEDIFQGFFFFLASIILPFSPSKIYRDSRVQGKKCALPEPARRST
jgi:hypothetical protein